MRRRAIDARRTPALAAAVRRSAPSGSPSARGRDGDAPAATIRGRARPTSRPRWTALPSCCAAARRPLLHGFDGATVEDARAAVALADRLGAIVATGALAGAWPGAPAVPLRGASTATLGEIRDRSRVVVIWREDPETTHPAAARATRLRRRSQSRLRRERTLVVVDDRDTATTARAPTCDLRWPARARPRGADVLHVMQRGLAWRVRATSSASSASCSTGIGAVPHAAFVYGPGSTAGAGGQRRALALHELVRELSHGRHVVTLALPRRCRDQRRAGRAGLADRVLRERRPRQRSSGAGHRDRVAAGRRGESMCRCASRTTRRAARRRRDADRALQPCRSTERRCRSAPRRRASPRAGTAHRLDGVPLTLQAPLPGDAPTAAALLDPTAGGARAMTAIRISRRRDPRPRQRDRRRGPRPVPAGRQGRRRRRARRPPDRRPRDGRDAGRRRHPRPHRGPQGQRCAQAVARRPPRRSAGPHRAAALGHRRAGALDVRHRLPLLAAGLHDGGRGRGAAAGRAPRARRAARHADDRQGVPDPDGQQPGAVRADPRVRRRRFVAAARTRSPGGWRRPAATASSSSTPAASSCGSRATATSTRSTTRSRASG